MSCTDPAFDVAVNAVLDEEGGYHVDPADPGGETNFGIAKRFHPDVDIKNLTRDQAIAIYKAEYWEPIAELYTLPAQFMRCAFECAVNQGLKKAEDLIVLAKGDLAEFQSQRALAYTRSANFAIYGHGWLKRLFKEMLNGS